MKKIKLSKRVIRGTECLNCGRKLGPNDNFCPECSQKNDQSRVSLKNYISEYLSGFFSFDNRFAKTIIPLLFKPGKVTREFIEGKRARYVNPIRLYLHITIVFFLILGFFNFIEDLKESNLRSKTKIEQKEIFQALDSLNLSDPEEKVDLSDIDTVSDTIRADSLINQRKGIFKKVGEFLTYGEEHEVTDILSALDSLGYKKTYWNIFIFSKSQNINRIISDKTYAKSYVNNLISKISIALFFLLPLFTLIVYLLYLRKDYNYSEHLVFVFYTQTVFFILLTVFVIFDLILDTDAGSLIFIFLFLFYLYKALRNFYGQSRFITFIKFVILNITYLIMATFGGLIIMFIAFLF